jgi:prepilin-type N-terminal cleavage/methylation domain-containing protein
VFKSLLARVREARAAELENEGGLEGGFTLIELMVVLLIIAILLAIAIPTFLGVTGSAKDRAAQSTLTNVLTETVAQYQNNQQYPALQQTNPPSSSAAGPCSDATSTGCTTAINPDNYSASDPQFSWKDGYISGSACTVAQAPKCVSVAPVDVAAVNDLQGVVLAVMSQTGTCWWSVNLQANPAQSTVSGETSGTPLKSTSITTAGTFYAKQASSTHCYAAYSTSAGFNWGSSYASAGSN